MKDTKKSVSTPFTKVKSEESNLLIENLKFWRKLLLILKYIGIFAFKDIVPNLSDIKLSVQIKVLSIISPLLLLIYELEEVILQYNPNWLSSETLIFLEDEYDICILLS